MECKYVKHNIIGVEHCLANRIMKDLDKMVQEALSSKDGDKKRITKVTHNVKKPLK
jgi:hypothetical protein